MSTIKNSIPNGEDSLHEPLYIQLYLYYKALIEKGTLEAGAKLPSIRKCAMERRISRTTVEAAYMQLAAEGYVLPQSGSGFYVTALQYPVAQPTSVNQQFKHPHNIAITYDFASAAVDDKSFNFDLWRRYIKSALRNTTRLLSYGEAQGEYDLRQAICHYIREKRGVVCTPEQIVIGAGVQSLLHIVCSLTGICSPIVFTGGAFKQGKAVFEDRGFETLEYGRVVNDCTYFEEVGARMLYTSPSHTTPLGDAMPMQTRLTLLSYAEKNKCLIIEDDYDSEFNYYTRPTPSLQGIDGGRQVVYMGTFSKLLLPSLRISFMVLPVSLMEVYENKGHLYNQTASKAEQIALCQFIRDGHLEKQIKKARKVYLAKKEVLAQSIKSIFGDCVTIDKGTSGFLMCMTIRTALSAQKAKACLQQRGIRMRAIEEENGYLKIILSCSEIKEEHFEEALQIVKCVLVKEEK